MKPISIKNELLQPFENKSNLDNSRPLDVHRWSEHPEINLAVNHILQEIRSSFQTGRIASKKLHYHVKVVLLDVYCAWLGCRETFVAYSRNKNTFNSKRLKDLRLSGGLLVRVIDALAEAGYLENHKGVHFEHFKRQSRIRATEKLIDCIIGYNVIPSMISVVKREIILRDKNKKECKYRNNAMTRKMRDAIARLNSFLSDINIEIELNSIDKQDILRIMRRMPDFSKVRFHRIFNGKSFKKGGRCYGHWVQGIPREYRRKISINGEQVCEYDYSGLHIRLLYALKSLPAPVGDVYAIDGYDPAKRPLLKTILQAIINAETIQAANRGAAYQARQMGIAIEKGEVKILAMKLMKKHALIKEFFCSGKGVELQFIDSEMAVDILMDMMDKGIPCLPMHDSFIVPVSRGAELVQAMEQAFFRRYGELPKIDRKY